MACLGVYGCSESSSPENRGDSCIGSDCDACAEGNCDQKEEGCDNADLSSSNEHCGACHNACGINAECVNAVCVCMAGYYNCDNDKICESRSECQSSGGDSTCVGVDCGGEDGNDDKESEACNGVDLMTSQENCGECNHSCGKYGVCVDGSCSCPEGYSDCDSNGTCETVGECECHLGETKECYSGPEGTKDVGECHAGHLDCIVSEKYGAYFDFYCTDEVVPRYSYVCDASRPELDLDCNGIPETQQDEDGDGFTICKDGEIYDCCDNTYMCSTMPERSLALINPGKKDCYGNNIDDNCNGEIDEDPTLLCSSGSTTTDSCTIKNRTCGDNLDLSSWSADVSKRTNAALSLIKAMDVCMDVNSADKLGDDGGLIEYNLHKSGYESKSVNMLQASVSSGMRNTSQQVLIPPRAGSNMVILSSGYARDAYDINANRSDQLYDSSYGNDCSQNNKIPEVFSAIHKNLTTNEKCSSTTKTVCDSAVLHLKLKAPVTAKGFSFDFRFFSREYPFYVCTAFNDIFLTILTDEDGKALVDVDGDGDLSDEDGNISFDKQNNLVSVNNAFFTTCAAPTCGDTNAMQLSSYSQQCPANYDKCTNNHCGTCEDGADELFAYYPTPYTGSGDGTDNRGGGTAWLTTKAPITGGQVFNLDFYIWDTGDARFDSSVILDNFQWLCEETTVGTDFAGAIEVVN